jgi:hypothetical protein
MAWGNLLHAHVLESGDDAPYAMLARPPKMETTQDEVDILVADLFGPGHHPIHSWMSTAGHHNEAL